MGGGANSVPLSSHTHLSMSLCACPPLLSNCSDETECDVPPADCASAAVFGCKGQYTVVQLLKLTLFNLSENRP